MSRNAITRHGNDGNAPIQICTTALRFYFRENFAGLNSIKWIIEKFSLL